jgi:hypothetical protein
MPLESTPLLQPFGSSAAGAPAAAAPRCGASFFIALRATFALLLFAAAGFSVYSFVDIGLTAHRLTFLQIVSGISLPFLCVTLPLSLLDIVQHLARYEHTVQRLYIRILLMVPIYAAESYAALRYPSAHFVLETLRESYECVALLAVFWLAVETIGSRRDVIAVLNEGAGAYVARVFAEEEEERAERGADAGGAAPVGFKGDGVSRTERLLLGLLDGSAFTCGLGGGGGAGGDDGEARGAAAGGAPRSGAPTVRLMLPFCCLGRWRLGASFFHRCHLGVAQYVVVRITCSLATVATASLGVYGNGSYDAGAPSLWLTIAINTSQLWALYCLIFFAAVLWPALTPMRPLGKFLLVKVVVFGFWWQSVMMGILADWGALKALEPPDQSAQAMANYETALVLQDALIAVECLLIAVAHHYTFGLRDFLRADFQWALGRRGRTRAAAEAAGARLKVLNSGGGPPFADADAAAASPAPRPNVGSDLLFLDLADDSVAVVRSAGSAAVGAIRAIAKAAAASPSLARRGLLSSEAAPAGAAGAGAVVPGEGALLAEGAGGTRWSLGVTPGAQL